MAAIINSSSSWFSMPAAAAAATERQYCTYTDSIQAIPLPIDLPDSLAS